MNYGISILFRAIPLIMAALCFGYGLFICLYTRDASRLTAGAVVFFLGMVCLNLFATAAIIIRQIINTFSRTARILIPTMAYSIAVITTLAGILIYVLHPHTLFVAGHVIEGLGFICFCIATVATASTRFSLIPANSAQPESDAAVRASKAFSSSQENIMKAVTLIAALFAWGECFVLLSFSARGAEYLVAGSVAGGIALICSALIALVYSILNQISGLYDSVQKNLWPKWVLSTGTIAAVWGAVILILFYGTPVDFVGFLLIGLSLICFSISSKVILLAKVWKADFALANRIPIIPVITALTCLFLSAFLFEASSAEVKFAVPARVLAAFGAVCFTLFSIVSILESGTKH